MVSTKFFRIVRLIKLKDSAGLTIIAVLLTFDARQALYSCRRFQALCILGAESAKQTHLAGRSLKPLAFEP
jgi:hypothetical protein